MLMPFLPLALVQATSTVVMTAGDRIAAPAVSDAKVDELAIRISSPAGPLWQGTLRVAMNQGASYSQSLSQASTELCPAGVPYDRSERSSVSFNIYAQNYGQGRPSYRLDVSWGRPIVDANCGESGTRTVQITQSVTLDPGQTATIEGDAGLRVELSRQR